MTSEKLFLGMTREQCVAAMAVQRSLAAKARREGSRIDADAHDNYADALRDALKGIKRCPECGRKMR